MTAFPEPPKDDYGLVNLDETDKPLPAQLNPRTRYAYFKTIAKGGKCVVQSCKDLHLGRIVCYKTLRPEFLDDPVEQVRFLREARVTAMLQHPGIVPTYELGRDNRGYFYFTMKLVHGYTLREVLDYRERYDLKQLIDVVIQVAHALEYAHAHRVIHRDIKPENILIGKFGEILLLDWGLAKVWRPDGSSHEINSAGQSTSDLKDKPNSMTGQGKLQGTVCYMSPEQIRRDPLIDYRSDIFSLGAVLYEILSGQTLVQGETVDEVTRFLLAGDFPRASKVSSLPVPRLLDDIAIRCISPDPEDRYRNCGEVVRLFQEDW